MEKKAERFSQKYVATAGYDACSLSIKEITNATLNTPAKVVLRTERQIPKFTAWVPISKDFIHLDPDVTICSYPQQVVQGDLFKDYGTVDGALFKKTKGNGFEVALSEYEQHRIADKIKGLPPREEMENFKSMKEDHLDKRQKLDARVEAGAKESHPSIASLLRDSLEMNPNEDMQQLISLSREKVEERNALRRVHQVKVEMRTAKRQGFTELYESPTSTEFLGEYRTHWCLLCSEPMCNLRPEDEFRVLPVNPIMDQFILDREKELNGKIQPCSARCYSVDTTRFGGVEKRACQVEERRARNSQTGHSFFWVGPLFFGYNCRSHLQGCVPKDI